MAEIKLTIPDEYFAAFEQCYNFEGRTQGLENPPSSEEFTTQMIEEHVQEVYRTYKRAQALAAINGEA